MAAHLLTLTRRTGRCRAESQNISPMIPSRLRAVERLDLALFVHTKDNLASAQICNGPPHFDESFPGLVGLTRRQHGSRGGRFVPGLDNTDAQLTQWQRAE